MKENTEPTKHIIEELKKTPAWQAYVDTYKQGGRQEAQELSKALYDAGGQITNSDTKKNVTRLRDILVFQFMFNERALEKTLKEPERERLPLKGYGVAFDNALKDITADLGFDPATCKFFELTAKKKSPKQNELVIKLSTRKFRTPCCGVFYMPVYYLQISKDRRF